MKSQFIVIEGLEGAGKSSAIIFLRELLTHAGITQIVTTREPGGTRLGEAIRQWVKSEDQQEQLTAQAELLLMYASRAQLTQTLIKPALAAGNWVLSDRFDLSTRAYQGGGRGIPDKLISQLHQLILGNFGPDLIIFLDLDPKIGLQRLHNRSRLDRFEQESESFFRRTRDKYLQIAKQDENIIVIDASQPITQVQQAIAQQLVQRYPQLQIYAT